MLDILLFAILFALAFLAAHQESLTMLALGLLGAMIGSASHALLTSLYPWWTLPMGFALTILLLVVGLWGVGHRQESARLTSALIGALGAAGLLTVILLPFLVSVFERLPLSTYAPMLFVGTLPELLWTLGAFGALVVASRMGR